MCKVEITRKILKPIEKNKVVAKKFIEIPIHPNSLKLKDHYFGKY